MVLEIYGLYLVLLSLITFCAYGLDKKKAIKGKRRISEKTLISLSLVGGALGGLIGMMKFRHKTSGEHWYFKFFNIIGLIAHIGIFIYLATTVV